MVLDRSFALISFAAEVIVFEFIISMFFNVLVKKWQWVQMVQGVQWVALIQRVVVTTRLPNYNTFYIETSPLWSHNEWLKRSRRQWFNEKKGHTKVQQV